MNALTKFIKEVREEMEKVVWPSREEALRLTAVVLGVAIFVSVYVAFLDRVFSNLVRTLLTGF